MKALILISTAILMSGCAVTLGIEKTDSAVSRKDIAQALGQRDKALAILVKRIEQLEASKEKHD